ncbi:hypothetical protein J6TS1_24920 [Siminovitchia terrae]|uniref:Uncharacterized protein n=1 Tax=Siminovitchia terrae TaxID=1914933 RepID=A0ABQ4KZA7_SIMTE|nr:hypothetical protein [Siminovitchia terrae]GIN96622.1 hypothetical protein J6TS1_24920 [Siminovitchia terrae]
MGRKPPTKKLALDIDQCQLFNFIQQKSPTTVSGEMNNILVFHSVGVPTPAE